MFWEVYALDRQEYLKSLTEQIRTKRARTMVAEEVEAHIEDQKQDFMAHGLGEEEAESMAVVEMGDPVETGVSLDRIHRPHMEWSTLFLVGVIGIFSVILYMFAPFDYNEDIQNMSWYGMRQLVFTVAGYAVMLLVCRLDYSILDRFGTLAAGIVVALMLLATQFGLTVNGATYCLYLGGMQIPTMALQWLYVPLFGAVLYHYRGQGYGCIWKLLLWVLLPTYAGLIYARFVFTMLMCLGMLVLTIVAVSRDWYQVNKKRTLTGLTICVGALPLVLIMILTRGQLLAPYQQERMEGFLTGSQTSYITLQASKTLAGSHLIGGNTELLQSAQNALPSFGSSYLLVALACAYGWLVVAVVVILLAVLILKMFHISSRQKNQLGMITGYGCGIVFMLQFIMTVAVNLGLLPPTSIVLPLFAGSGGGSIIASYILLGLTLSIYRYKDITTERMPRKQKITEICE